MKEGKPIFVESLMNPTEYKEMSKKFPNTYGSSTSPDYFEGEFAWRYRMGMSMTESAISTNNRTLAIILQKIKA